SPRESARTTEGGGMRKSSIVVAGAACMLALLISAAAAQGAGHNPVKGFSHLQELTAMNNRYQAQVNRIATSSGSYFSHLADLSELKDSTRPLARPTVAADRNFGNPSPGFRWDDAGIGAAGGILAAAIVAGSVVVGVRLTRRDAEP